MNKETISRETLYNLAWSKPISEIAKEYDSDHQPLIGICNEFNIPRPESGHWTKIRFGKLVSIPALPDSELSDISLTLSRKKFAPQLTKSTEQIRVKPKIGLLHPLTQKTYDYLKGRQTSQHGRLRTRGASILDMSVTPKHLSRATRIIDSVVIEFEKNGFEVKTTSYNELSKSYVLIDEEEIYFHIHEKGKRIKKPNPRYSFDSYDHVNTGELVLGLSDSKFWSRTRSIADGKTQKLEEKIGKFFLTAFDIANELFKERIESNKRQEEAKRIREEKERVENRKQEIKRLREERLQEEINKRIELETLALDLFKADQILALIDSVDKEIKNLSLTDIQINKHLKWKQYAIEHSKRLNPIESILSKVID